MRSWPLRVIAVAIVLPVLALGLPAGRAGAADVRSGDAVLVGPGETIDDDLYAFAATITIQGTVNGDLVAAGQSVVIAGTVTGDVIAAANTVTISGRVGGTLRAAAVTVTLAGDVARDAVIGSGNLTLAPNASIGRDLLLGVGQGTIGGRVARTIVLGGGTINLAGQVGGDVRGEVGTLSLAPGATVDGALRYTSDNEAQIAQGATVRGGVERTAPQRREGVQAAASPVGGVIDWVRALVGVFVLGFVFLALVPRFSRCAADSLALSLGSVIAYGAVALVGLPVLAVVVLLVGLLIGGWWLAALALALYGVLLALGYVVVSYFAGRWLLVRAGRAELHPALMLLVGAAILLLLGAIPVLGGIVTLIVLLLGSGALIAAFLRERETSPPAPAPADVPPPAPV